jgi:hypothetical protein
VTQGEAALDILINENKSLINDKNVLTIENKHRIERSHEKKKRYMYDNDLLVKDNELLITETNILKELNIR